MNENMLLLIIGLIVFLVVYFSLSSRDTKIEKLDYKLQLMNENLLRTNTTITDLNANLVRYLDNPPPVRMSIKDPLIVKMELSEAKPEPKPRSKKDNSVKPPR